MFADSEDIEPDLIGVDDLRDEVLQRERRRACPLDAFLRVRWCKAIDTDFHERPNGKGREMVAFSVVRR
jgi:hypothetical protein